MREEVSLGHLTTENFRIQDDRQHWPIYNIEDYRAMVNRVNELHPQIIKIRIEILRLESLLENSY